ncbi:MAG: site-specific integrase [Syntrophobacteraceae bacterium]
MDLEKLKAKAYFPTVKVNLTSFNAVFGSRVISQLKAVDLENYQAKRKAAGYSDAYVDYEIGAARTMIYKAFDNDMVSGETVKVFRRVKRLLKANANARDRIISLDEFNGLLKNLPPITRAIVATAFHTGMRRGEILSLTWDKVDLNKNVIRLEAEDTKDKEPRLVPICPALYAVFRSLPRALHDLRLFPHSSQKALRSRLDRDMVRACGEAGILYGRKVKGGLTFHDLRHTFNTYMRKAGVPQSVIMKITGHSTDKMFRRYNTVDAEDASAAIEKMDRFLATLDQTLDQTSSTPTVKPN